MHFPQISDLSKKFFAYRSIKKNFLIEIWIIRKIRYYISFISYEIADSEILEAYNYSAYIYKLIDMILYLIK